MQHKNGNFDRETVSQTEGEVKTGRKLSNSARKRRPGGWGGESKELWEEKKDEEWLKPKWQRLHLHPPLPVILAYPSPCSVFPHLSFPTSSPIPLFGYLNLSILLLSRRPAQTEGWRVQALQRQRCGDCVSCGSHSSLACRLHRQLLGELILNQLASDRGYIWIIWSRVLDKQLLQTRCGPLKVALRKSVWPENWLGFNHTRSREKRRNY